MGQKFDQNNYIGKEFEYLTILKFVEPTYYGNNYFVRRCLCRCRCGKEKVFNLQNILQHLSKSCGCKSRSTHNEYINTSLYRRWANLKNICKSKNPNVYKYYGKFGIRVCDEWLDFYKFREWALNNGYKENLHLQRKDTLKDFSPDNCVWITQNRVNNSRKFDNVLIISSVAKKTGYTRERIRQLSNREELQEFIISKEKLGKNIRVIFKEEVIGFLKERRIKNSAWVHEK